MVALSDGAIQVRGTPEEAITEGHLTDVFEIEAQADLKPLGPRIERFAPSPQRR